MKIAGKEMRVYPLGTSCHFEGTNGMVHVAICDDEAVAVNILKKKIASCLSQEKAEYEVETFTDAVNMRNRILDGGAFQVLFLDIDMPELDGLRLAEHIRKSGFSSLIIFITNQSELVYDSLRVQPFRFIRKNKFNEEIGIVIHDALQALLPKPEESLVLRRGTEVFCVNPYDIMYVESQRKLQYIHTASGIVEAGCGMDELCQELSGYGFIRCHKSYAVNYRFIQSIGKTDLVLDNKELIPVSRGRIKEVKHEFQVLMMRG